MNRTVITTLSIAVLIMIFMGGWFLGRADHAAASNSMRARLAILLAERLDRKDPETLNQLFLQIDASVLAMNAVYPFTLDQRKRNQIEETYAAILEFRKLHPDWTDYLSTQTSSQDRDFPNKVSAILAGADEYK